MDRRHFVSAASLAGLGSARASVSMAAAASVAASGEAEEPPLEPTLPIVDAHHHLWDFPVMPGYPVGRFLLPEFLDDIDRSGHHITHTVFAECHSMYRADGPESLKTVGETEFVNGVAAMAASGRYGTCRVAAGIVGTADLRLGDAVREVLAAQMRAAPDRFRGVRIPTEWADTPIFGQPPNPRLRDVLRDARVRRGGAILGELGLSWDVWIFHTQLAEFADLADAVPRTTLVLDHLGTPLSLRSDPSGHDEVFEAWRRGIIEVARRPNVVVKLGGLGMNLAAGIGATHRGASSADLVPEWRPYIETAIEKFGADRCMFESNVPPDLATCSYGAIWNTFKRITAGSSPADKAHLYSDTAKRIYRL